MQKNAHQKYQKCKNAHKKCKKHQFAKNDISVLTDTLPSRRGSDIVLVRSFHHMSHLRYYRDFLESIRPLIGFRFDAVESSGSSRRRLSEIILLCLIVVCNGLPLCRSAACPTEMWR
jgi:hypothetical protein